MNNKLSHNSCLHNCTQRVIDRCVLIQSLCKLNRLGTYYYQELQLLVHIHRQLQVGILGYKRIDPISICDIQLFLEFQNHPAEYAMQNLLSTKTANKFLLFYSLDK